MDGLHLPEVGSTLIRGDQVAMLHRPSCASVTADPNSIEQHDVGHGVLLNARVGLHCAPDDRHNALMIRVPVNALPAATKLHWVYEWKSTYANLARDSRIGPPLLRQLRKVLPPTVRVHNRRQIQMCGRMIKTDLHSTENQSHVSASRSSTCRC